MSHYPAISHAFVVREVRALRAAGVDVATLSIHRANPEDLLATADREEAAATLSILPVSPGALAGAHVRAFARAPLRYISTLTLALHTGAAGARERLWHLFYFAEAMVLLEHCHAADVTHIHAQFADAATDAAMLVSHYERGGPTRSRITWSLAVHGSVEFFNVERYAISAKLADAAFAVAISDFGRSQLMTLSSRERWDHIHVVRCGVDLDVYRPPAARPPRPTSVEVLCVGRLLRGKGLSLLFEAVAQLRSEGHSVHIRLVGDGPERADLEAEADRLRLSEVVHFEGAVGQDDIHRFYASADIFCLPSFAEGIPVVAMEAMAMELPVVTTRIMGIPELVEDGVQGLLVPPGRVDALVDALRELATAKDLRVRMGKAGREKVRRDFDVAQSARVMRDALTKELSSSRALDPHRSD